MTTSVTQQHPSMPLRRPLVPDTGIANIEGLLGGRCRMGSWATFVVTSSDTNCPTDLGVYEGFPNINAKMTTMIVDASTDER